MGAQTINPTKLLNRTIDRALYPDQARELIYNYPGDGTNPVTLDLAQLWEQEKFAVTGVVVDLSQIWFFSNSNTNVVEKYFSEMGLGLDYIANATTGVENNNPGLYLRTSGGEIHYCRCREITTIPLAGERVGSLIIGTGQSMAAMSGILGPTYPMGPSQSAPAPAGTNSFVSRPFTIKFLNVPVEYSREPFYETDLMSVFDARLDEHGDAMNSLRPSIFGSGVPLFLNSQNPRPKTVVAVPERIVSFNNNDGGGPYCAPETFFNSYAEDHAVAGAASGTVPASGAFQFTNNLPLNNQQHKSWQHFHIEHIKVQIGAMVLAGGIGTYHFDLYFQATGTNASREGIFWSETFFYDGQADYVFEMEDEFYINLLDWLTQNSNPAATGPLNNNLAIYGVFTNTDANAVSDWQGALGMDIRFNVMENPINKVTPFN